MLKVHLNHTNEFEHKLKYDFLVNILSTTFLMFCLHANIFEYH